MTFDYYDNLPHEMADNTESAATAIFNVLRRLYPGKSPAQVWSMIGLCEDIGSGQHDTQRPFSSVRVDTLAVTACCRALTSAIIHV